MSVVVPGVTDVEFLSSQELMNLVLRRTGEAVEVDELESKDKLLEAARVAVLSHLTVSELRGLVTQSGLSTRDCVTKGDLRLRAVDAVKRLRLARQIPTRDQAISALEQRIRNTYKRYEVSFEGKKLGLSIGMLTKATTGEKWVVTTSVSRTDIPALQPGDEILYIQDAPLAPCRTSAEFRQAVSTRIQDAPRPLKITFATGDGRWPPDLPSRHELALNGNKRKKKKSASSKQTISKQNGSFSKVSTPPTKKPPVTPPSTGSYTSRHTPRRAASGLPQSTTPPSKNNHTPSTVDTMTIKDLRNTIERAGMSHKNIIEKAELRIVAEEAIRRIEKLNRPPSSNWEAFIAEQQRKTKQYKEQNNNHMAAALAEAEISLGTVDEAEPQPPPPPRTKPPPPPTPSPRIRSQQNKPKPPPPPPRESKPLAHLGPMTSTRIQREEPPIIPTDTSIEDDIPPIETQVEHAIDRMHSFVAHEEDDHLINIPQTPERSIDDDDQTWNSVSDQNSIGSSSAGGTRIPPDGGVTTTPFGVNITHSCEM